MSRWIGFVLMIVLTACCDTPPSPAQAVFEGDHDIRQMKSEVTKTPMRGSFFLFSGDITGGGTVLTVTFAWESQGQYLITTLPLEKVRIKLRENKSPSVSFRWRPAYVTDFTPSDLIIYAVITCSPEDWPVNITLPLSDYQVKKSSDCGGDRC